MHVDLSRVYRVKDIATRLDVSVSTVYRAIDAGRLDALRVGQGRGAVRVPGEALAAWLVTCGRQFTTTGPATSFSEVAPGERGAA